ncbi:MAG: protein phosphatase 2C domain-containing protein, partial [Allobaculum sp.]|nr:protein phosphatase 2C domain-containing protein [Allobaculum sp.]
MEINSAENENIRRQNLFDNKLDMWAYCISQKGSDHIRVGTPCQDYSAFDINDDDYCGVFVVSDGHGSAPLSEFGSEFAVQAVIETVRKCKADCYSDNDLIRFFTSDYGKRIVLENWTEKVLSDWTTKDKTEFPTANTDDAVID